MKSKNLLAVFTFCFFSTLLSAQVDNAILCKYAASSRAESTQEYKVAASLATNGSSLAVTIAVVWQPGVSCEIDLLLDPSAVIKTIDPNGHDKYAISADFEDSFSNRGTLSLEIHDGTCVLNLTATEKGNTRATRQYGTYTLARVNDL